MGKSNQHRLKKQIREYPSHNCPKEHERVFWEELSEEGTMTWDLKREKEPVKKRLNSLQFQAGDSANGRVLRWEHMGWKSMVETKFKSPVSGSQVFSTWRYFCLDVPSLHAKSLQSCLTLCDPIDGSPPGSSVHRILQARILEWVAISFSNS